MGVKGIDVSSYQGDIEWNKVRNDGVSFAILKVIRKDLQPDKRFERNWSECIKNNILIQGVYNYSYATTVEKAKIDALTVIKIQGNRRPMVWLDVEDNCQKNLGNVLIQIIRAYRTKIEDSGRPFGVYTGLSFYNTYIKPYAKDVAGIPFWIARYPSNNPITVKSLVNPLKKPIIKNPLYGWQYSSKCQINGIVGNTDVNEWYVSVESTDYFNYEGKSYMLDPVCYGDSGKHVQVMQQLLLKNRFRTAIVIEKGKEVRKDLVDDGKFGPITLSVLKRYQCFVGLEQTGICDRETWLRLMEVLG